MSFFTRVVQGESREGVVDSARLCLGPCAATGKGKLSEHVAPMIILWRYFYWMKLEPSKEESGKQQCVPVPGKLFQVVDGDPTR